MPSREELEAKLHQAKEYGADYFKIAASAKTAANYQRLAAFTLENQRHGIIAVAMDTYGPLSRIALPGLGSALTYAFTAQPNAPGQLDYLQTRTLLENLYPHL